jgi:hypothetical protein
VDPAHDDADHERQREHHPEDEPSDASTSLLGRREPTRPPGAAHATTSERLTGRT